MSTFSGEHQPEGITSKTRLKSLFRKCPECGGEMKIVSIIDHHQKDVVTKILKHYDLWDDSSPLLAPNLFEAEVEFIEEVTIDPDFFDMIA